MSTPVAPLTITSLNNLLSAEGIPLDNSRRPFWYSADDGEVRRQRQVDASVQVQQKLLEASFSANIPSYPLESPYNNVSHYRSVVYLAIQAQMNALSAGNLVMEMPRPGAASTGSHGDGDDGYVPFTDHQLYDYLREPSPTDSFSSFLGQIILQWYLTGRVLIWGVPNEWGLPVRFYVLPTALCQPAFNLNNELYPEGAWLVQQYYPYTGLIGLMPGPLGTPGAIIDAREVYQMKNPHPLYKWAPFSPMTGVSVGIDVLEMIDRSCWSVYRQGVKPTGVLTVPGAGRDQLDDLDAQINNKYAGPDNAGKIFTVGGRPDSRAPGYTPLNNSPESMAYDTRAVYESLILAGVTGSDRAVVGLREGGSYSERWAAIQDVQIRTYEPMLRRISDVLNMGPVKQWGLSKRRVRVRIKLPKLDDPTLREAQINARSADGTYTTDEVRAQSGMPPDPLGLGHLPTGVRQQMLLLMAEQGQLPGNPNPPGEELEIQDIDDPSDDGTALGTLRAGIELPGGEPVGVVGQPAPKSKTGGPKKTPNKPAGAGKKKPPAKGKKVEKKALPEDPSHRTEAVVGIHRELQADPLNHQLRGVYADALDDAGAYHEAAVHRALGTVRNTPLITTLTSLPVDPATAHAATHIANEMTQASPSTMRDGEDHIWRTHSEARRWSRAAVRETKVGDHEAAAGYHGTAASYHYMLAGHSHDNSRHGALTADEREYEESRRDRHYLVHDAHRIANGLHQRLADQARESKALSAYTDAAGGSLTLPPGKKVRRKRKARRGLKSIVAEVLGGGDTLVEVKAEAGVFNRVAATRHHLANLPVVHIKPLAGKEKGVNGSSLVTLDHPRRQIRGIFKPTAGEQAGMRWTIPDHGQATRESAASHVAEIVGVHDLVPATTTRTHLGLHGSIQRFVPGGRPGYSGGDGDWNDAGPSHHDILRAGAFDYLIGNTDRHPGNWLVRPHKAQGEKLTLIDHGLSFPEKHTEYNYNALLHEHAAHLQERHGHATPDLGGHDPDGRWMAIHRTLREHGLSPAAIKETSNRWRVLTGGRHTLRDMFDDSPDTLLGGK